jgi:hypothetical protein
MKSRFLAIFLFIAAGLEGQSEPPGLFGPLIVHPEVGGFAKRLRD